LLAALVILDLAPVCDDIRDPAAVAGAYGIVLEARLVEPAAMHLVLIATADHQGVEFDYEFPQLKAEHRVSPAEEAIETL